ncbi:MAG TPA: helix-turn-helix domain-containing protein [Capsulimonadaceae bacterium]|jgi:AcrR family transcriptional regulator
MARQTTITDDQILNAARSVFLEEGFRAQTAKIARLAGVSEGTIFKRFETKEHLIAAALQIPHPPPWYKDIERLGGIGDLKENLVTIGVGQLTYFQQTLPRILAAAGHKIPPPLGMPPPEDHQHSLLARDLQVIKEFLDNEVQLCRLRQIDTSVLASMLFGCFAGPMIRVTLAKDLQGDDDLREFARKTIDMLWGGIQPTDV